MPTVVLLLQGHTPLIFASIGGHAQIVQMLLSHKADPLPCNGHVSPTLPNHWWPDCTLYCNLSASICSQFDPCAEIQNFTVWPDWIISKVSTSNAFANHYRSMPNCHDKSILPCSHPVISCLPVVMRCKDVADVYLRHAMMLHVFFRHAMMLLTSTYAMQWCCTCSSAMHWCHSRVLMPCSDVAYEYLRHAMMLLMCTCAMQRCCCPCRATQPCHLLPWQATHKLQNCFFCMGQMCKPKTRM